MRLDKLLAGVGLTRAQAKRAVADGRATVNEALCVRCGYCAAVCPQFCLKVI